ncbi:MAG: PD-(D/E)XK nuclease family protein, partial [Thermoplasmata archaeon]|nr:PD-(D/E)XK nuclease family protein [Thermoplasmata archaeon]
MAKILDAYGRTVLSASQVDTFLDCVRKWAWRYLEGVKAPPHPSAKLGTRCHTIAEAWLLKGTQPDGLEVMTLPAGRYGEKTKDYYPGQIITAGLPLLPPPGVASVESRFTFYTKETAWQGYRDAMYIQEVGNGEAHPPGIWPSEWECIPVVLDHKTTSHFKWAKSVEDLLQDTQANLYAAKTMEDFHTPHVLARWIYYRTKGQPLARPVEVEFHGAQVAQVIARLDETAKEIHQLYKLRPKALDLKPSPASCDKYGGCPHKGRCNLGVVERMEALMSTESIQEMMTRKTAERDAQAAGGVPPLAPPPVQAPPVPPVQHVFQIGEQLGATPPGQVMVDHLASLGLSTAQTAGGWVVVALAPPPAPEAQTAAHAHPPAPPTLAGPVTSPLQGFPVNAPYWVP